MTLLWIKTFLLVNHSYQITTYLSSSVKFIESADTDFVVNFPLLFLFSRIT